MSIMIAVKAVETMSIILLLWENSALFTAQYMGKTHQKLGCETCPSTPLRYAQDEWSKSENVEQLPLMLSVAVSAAKSKHESRSLTEHHCHKGRGDLKLSAGGYLLLHILTVAFL